MISFGVTLANKAWDMKPIWNLSGNTWYDMLLYSKLDVSMATVFWLGCSPNLEFY